MAFLVELNEATAARRRVPFRLFTSNGTSPDTNASDGTILWSVNGGAQLSAVSISAISANAGLYYAEFSQSNVSVLGSIAVYTDTIATDFPQHVATVQVVNSNPFSTLSAISNVTLANTEYSAVTVRIGLVTYSGATVGAGNFAPGSYSGVSFSVRDSGIATSSFQAGTYSNVTAQGVINVDSGVSIRAGSHSGATIQGLSNYANISTVTLHAGTHSDATVQGISNYANISNVTLAAGTHSNVTIQGVTLLNSNVTLRAGSHSGATLDGVLFLGTAGERSVASSWMSTNLGQNRYAQEALFALRNRVQISGSTGTVFNPDDTTSSWTFSVTTSASALAGIDPGGL